MLKATSFKNSYPQSLLTFDKQGQYKQVVTDETKDWAQQDSGWGDMPIC